MASTQLPFLSHISLVSDLAEHCVSSIDATLYISCVSVSFKHHRSWTGGGARDGTRRQLLARFRSQSHASRSSARGETGRHLGHRERHTVNPGSQDIGMTQAQRAWGRELAAVAICAIAVAPSVTILTHRSTQPTDAPTGTNIATARYRHDQMIRARSPAHSHALRA
jgi:hypothetical protein